MSTGSDIVEPKHKAEEANSLLDEVGRGSARWWQYNASLESFELLIGEPNGPNLVLALLACRFIAGPTGWSNANVRVHLVEATDETGGATYFELRDELAGFTARARLLSWRRNFDLLAHESVIFTKGQAS
jgi:hypothetical protein